jgi:cysteinyl-tRNA synthetase
MKLKVYSTLTRNKSEFKPIDQHNVRMYVCGPTVYDLAHIGNARPVIVFDIMFRLLRHIYGSDHVTYVRNITDVDDKINLRAAQEYPDMPLNEAIRKITDKTEQQFHEDVHKLHCLHPTVEPKATDHINEMIDIINLLIISGNAYVEENHVLFSVSSMPDYGKLSKRSIDEIMAIARVDAAPYKRNQADFVLWKPSKPNEPSWPSPAGIFVPGRPGWHLECSAMSWKYLGKSFDIHGGGVDLIFPHHENEIAQSQCAFHTPVMANYWMHNGFLKIEGHKMSKNDGNFITIKQLLDDWPGGVLRLNMLRTHYRQTIDWTIHGLNESEIILRRWYEAIHDTSLESQNIPEEITEALCDDLNTPEAISALHKLHKVGDNQSLYAALQLLGFDPSTGQTIVSDASETIMELIKRRTAARNIGNFIESDRIRNELAAMGITLKDTKDGTNWEYNSDKPK